MSMIVLILALSLLVGAYALIEEGRLASAVVVTGIAVLCCGLYWGFGPLPGFINPGRLPGWALVLVTLPPVALSFGWPYGLARLETRGCDDRNGWSVENRDRLHCIALLAIVHMPIYLLHRVGRWLLDSIVVLWRHGLERVLGWK